MSHPSKKVIQDRAISGLTVQGSDVAHQAQGEGYRSLRAQRVAGEHRCLCVGLRPSRHVRLARDLANAPRRTTVTHSKHGDQIDQISPDL